MTTNPNKAARTASKKRRAGKKTAQFYRDTGFRLRGSNNPDPGHFSLSVTKKERENLEK